MPPTASAEGETAALQAQVVEASLVDNKDAIKAKKGPDAGLQNYIVSLPLRLLLL